MKIVTYQLFQMGSLLKLHSFKTCTRREGIYCLQAYFSFIQHQSPGIVWSPEVTFFSWCDTIISFKDLEWVYSMSFEMKRKQVYRGSSCFMLDGWEVHLYTIILTPCTQTLPCHQGILLSKTKPTKPSNAPQDKNEITSNHRGQLYTYHWSMLFYGI